MTSGGSTLHSVLDIPWSRLSLLIVAVIGLWLLIRVHRMGLERTLLVASLRGPAQLFGIGAVLTAVFTIDRPELVFAILLIMLAVAARTAIARLSQPLPGLNLTAALCLASGTALSLVFMSRLIVRPDPWFDPQYLIPFAGMLLGNSMNSTAVAGERFQQELAASVPEIESRLVLGFTGPASVHGAFRRSLSAAMIPMLNSLMVAGVVQLPGMMTGQILSGVDPVIAVKYQILIFFLLLVSVTASTFLFLVGLRRRYVTPQHQLERGLIARIPQGGRTGG